MKCYYLVAQIDINLLMQILDIVLAIIIDVTSHMNIYTDSSGYKNMVVNEVV